jgi:hypothetical protein
MMPHHVPGPVITPHEVAVEVEVIPFGEYVLAHGVEA